MCRDSPLLLSSPRPCVRYGYPYIVFVRYYRILGVVCRLSLWHLSAIRPRIRHPARPIALLSSFNTYYALRPQTAGTSEFQVAASSFIYCTVQTTAISVSSPSPSIT